MMNFDKFDSFDNKSFTRFCAPAQIERDLQMLTGIITGIACDKKITEAELAGLNNWITNVATNSIREPYQSIIERIKLAIEDSVLTEEEKDDILWLSGQFLEQNPYYDAIAAGIQKLLGIMQGIIVDKEITIAELEFLDSWIEENSILKNTWPYDELCSLVTTIIADKVITDEEHKLLLNFCQELLRDKNNPSEESNPTQLLKMGFCQVEPEIKIAESVFCITGVSKKRVRKEIASTIELFGGYVTDSLSSKVNYLIVCDEKNSCWAFSCYGRKIEKAVHLRKSGAPLQIVHEYDLYDTIEDIKAN